MSTPARGRGTDPHTYRFQHAYTTAGGARVLVFERRVPGNSRVEQITCAADWFWGDPRVLSLAKALALVTEETGGIGSHMPYGERYATKHFLSDARAVLEAMDKGAAQ